MEVILNDIKLSPILESVQRRKISDQEYFSEEYSGYISNSRLKLINPDQNGSPSKYKKGFTGETTNSLTLGSAVHELFLQPETFILGPDLEKPSAKLGLVIDTIRELRIAGYTVNDAIVEACQRVHYYENNINISRVKSIIKSGLKYYCNCKYILDDNVILLSSRDREVVLNCIKNLTNNPQIIRLINPKDLFGDPILSYNEDAFFVDINAVYNGQTCVLKLKMKADNWTIDLENKIITLNDLKTTGHLISQFMGSNGSFEKFCYPRQFAYYIWILLCYCEKEYGYNPEEWTVKCNVIVVETTANNSTAVFPVRKDLLEQGRKEFCKLLKMVAYCEINSYSDDIVFV